AGMGAAADGDTIGVAGDHMHAVERHAEPFGHELGEARFVALALRGHADHQLDDAFRLDHNLGLFARHAGRDIDVIGDPDAAAFSALFRLAATARKAGPIAELERRVHRGDVIAAVVLHAERIFVRQLSLFDEVAPAQRNAIEAML